MKAFHNDPKIKEYYLERVRAHAAADEIAQGNYYKVIGGKLKACAVGCTIHGHDHSAYERELGIPMILARLEDRIFENLPENLMKTWPDRFLSAIEVGADLSTVWPKFAIFLLTDATQCASRHPQCDIVANKFQEQLNGEVVDWQDAAAASASAASAASAAADAAEIGRAHV